MPVDETRIIQGNALALPLEDESVDLIITSPPYFALRSYRDGDEHYEGQVGSEPTPAEFLEALWAATAEMVRVLKPTGSIWVNLGDKYAGSGGHNNAMGSGGKLTLSGGMKKLQQQADDAHAHNAARRNAPDRYNQNSGGIPAKSLMGLPWRYAIGCIDQLGLILRAEVIWSKPNGLPESVTDRVRRSHEQWFHFVRQGKYFAAVDEVREPYSQRQTERTAIYAGRIAEPRHRDGNGDGAVGILGFTEELNPLGKLPGSVWTVPSEPLIIPDAIKEHYDLPDHFAAFPQEWPRRIILGWSPSGICVECGEGRRPVVAKDYRSDGPRYTDNRTDALAIQGLSGLGRGNQGGHGNATTEATITGYACACGPNADGEYWFKCGVHPWLDIDHEGNQCGAGAHVSDIQPPTRPAAVLDPFCGTGTVPMVARALGRIGIGVELSADYCRLAEWRIFHSGHASKTESRTNTENQTPLF